MFGWILVAALLAACDGAVEIESDQRQLVRVAKVEQGRLQHQLSFSGVLQPVVRARLAFQTPGVLAARPVSLGQLVREGELLATLDNPELGPAQLAALARVQEAISRRDQARRDLARLQSLVRTGAVGEETVEQKQAELNSLQAALASVEANLTGTRQRLSDATLVAPFGGVISRIGAEPGEFVAAGQEVMSLGGLERVEVTVLLPASLVSELDNGDQLTVRVPQLRGRTWQGRVTELSAIGDVETGLFPVVVEVGVDPVTTRLRAGMLAEVLINYADVEGLIVPLEAIVDPVGGDPRVYRMHDGKVQSVPIEVLAVANERVAVRLSGKAGMQSGDNVVTAGHRALTDGQAVRPVK
jgi:multidrug efflux system membrane fusion protein